MHLKKDFKFQGNSKRNKFELLFFSADKKIKKEEPQLTWRCYFQLLYTKTSSTLVKVVFFMILVRKKKLFIDLNIKNIMN